MPWLDHGIHAVVRAEHEALIVICGRFAGLEARQWKSGPAIELEQIASYRHRYSLSEIRDFNAKSDAGFSG
jgi:hypothetical protein